MALRKLAIDKHVTAALPWQKERERERESFFIMLDIITIPEFTWVSMHVYFVVWNPDGVWVLASQHCDWAFPIASGMQLKLRLQMAGRFLYTYLHPPSVVADEITW
jgi:hypothetical protein